jgi:hypothetical protein
MHITFFNPFRILSDKIWMVAATKNAKNISKNKILSQSVQKDSNLWYINNNSNEIEFSLLKCTIMLHLQHVFLVLK